MPQASAPHRTSFFRSPTPDLAPAPWRGRVSTDDLARPGGLLFAALWQCASERGLSLSDLATALGVSYWSLSQLRIGFRPIETLDEDLAQACADYLDLPRLTVDMLAGLLDPTQALAEEDLSGEDILHARQLLVRTPDALLLLPAANRMRPLQGLAVDELAALHRAHGSNPAVVNALSISVGGVAFDDVSPFSDLYRTAGVDPRRAFRHGAWIGRACAGRIFRGGKQQPGRTGPGWLHGRVR